MVREKNRVATGRKRQSKNEEQTVMVKKITDLQQRESISPKLRNKLQQLGEKNRAAKRRKRQSKNEEQTAMVREKNRVAMRRKHQSKPGTNCNR
jgi:hypothetical protein